MENDKEENNFVCTGKLLIVGIILSQITFSFLENSEIFFPIVFNFLINFFQKRKQTKKSNTCHAEQ